MGFLTGQTAGLVQEIKAASEILREVAAQAEHILTTRLPAR